MIIINGHESMIQDTDLAYEDIVFLAHGSDMADKDIMTISYRKGPPENPEGSLIRKDGNIKLQDGMIFNVTNTSYA